MQVAETLFVLSAGALTLLSPCGYPLFVAYLLYYVGSRIPLRKVICGASVVSVGFLTVFVAIGLAPAFAGQIVLRYVPILIVVAGLIVIAFGAITLSGSKLSIRMPSIGTTGRSGFSGLFIFGLAFGMATAACSAPIFLTITLLAMASGGLLDVLFTFLVYALGMAVPVVVSGLLVATAREAVLRKLMGMRHWLDRISGMLMILVGIYLIYYYISTYWL
jgi:cytochrome c biogenesis protein CcdA